MLKYASEERESLWWKIIYAGSLTYARHCQTKIGLIESKYSTLLEGVRIVAKCKAGLTDFNPLDGQK